MEGQTFLLPERVLNMTPYKSEERIPYQTLKEWALSSYFDFCRDRGVVKGMSHLEVVGYVSYDFEYGFERQIEDVMWRVVLLVLSGGWHPDFDGKQHKLIVDKIAAHGLEDLLADVPQDEANLFRHDLEILKLV
jgi:hypothetical protein